MDEVTITVNGIPASPQGLDEDSTLLAQIQAAYEEVSRRDTRLEIRLAHAFRVIMALCATVGLLGIALVWFVIHRTDVQTDVQVVQVDEQRQVHLLGPPRDLLAYAPADGQWMDMLSELVRKLRWRGDDPQLAREHWRWANYHMCKDARQQLKVREEREKPFEVTAKKVAVAITRVTRTESPRAYNVFWQETMTEGYKQPESRDLVATFTVGRSGPPTVESALYNRLALCVTGFDMPPQ
jgi:type IV secretory pathway TrbF-like protein